MISGADIDRLEVLAAAAGFKPEFNRYSGGGDELWSKLLTAPGQEEVWAFLQFGTEGFQQAMLDILDADPADLPLMLVTLQELSDEGFELGKLLLVKNLLARS